MGTEVDVDAWKVSGVEVCDSVVRNLEVVYIKSLTPRVS